MSNRKKTNITKGNNKAKREPVMNVPTQAGFCSRGMLERVNETLDVIFKPYNYHRDL